MPNDNQINYFNLNGDGASAVVRLLHTSTKTIETAKVHNLVINQKKRTVKCCGDGCPLCNAKIPTYDRIFIHLIDYADGKEKVWSRTPTILKQLTELEASWGDLSALVLKVTRVGNEFPKYNIMMMPPQTFPPINRELVDVKIAYRFYMHRSAEELTQFLTTGVMPTHESKGFVSKEEYFKAMEKNGAVQQVVPNYPMGELPSYATQSPSPTYNGYTVPPTPPQYAPYQASQTYPSQSYTLGTPTQPQQPFSDPFGAFTRKA